MRIDLTSANPARRGNRRGLRYGRKRSTYTGRPLLVAHPDISDRFETDVTSVPRKTQCRAYSSVDHRPARREPTVLIRGVGSINAKTTPLYVVDGIPYDGGLKSKLNPQDVLVDIPCLRTPHRQPSTVRAAPTV